MTTERYTSVINVDYLGSRDVDRYIADLQRLGAITEKTAGQLRNALAGGLGGDSSQLRNALGIGAAGIQDYDRAAQKAIGTTDKMAAAAGRLRREIEALQGAMARAQGGALPIGPVQAGPAGPAAGGVNPTELSAAMGRELRRALYTVLQSNAVNQRIAVQGNQPLNPLSGGTPLALGGRSELLALESREIQERRASLDRQKKVQAATERAIESRINQIPILDFGPGGTMAIRGFIQETRDVTADLARLDSRISQLHAAIDEEIQAVKASTRNRAEANRNARLYNEEILQARITGAQALSSLGENTNGAPDSLPIGNRMFWEQGLANRKVLQEFRTPEERAFLIGETAGDPLREYAPLLKSLQRGLPVPGFTSGAQQLDDMAEQRVASKRRLIADLAIKRDDLAGTVGPFALPGSQRYAAAEERRLRVATALAAAEERRISLERLRNNQLEAAGTRAPLALPAGPNAPQAAIPLGSSAPRLGPIALGPGGAYAITSVGGGSAFGGGGIGGGGGSVPPRGPGGTGPSGLPGWMQEAERLLDELRSASPLEAKIKALRGRLAVALANLDAVASKGEIGIGEKGGFATEDARSKAYLQARVGVITAENSLARAEDLLAAETRKTTEARANERRAAERAAAAADRYGNSGAGFSGGGPGQLGTFAGDFGRGFRGERNAAPYAEQLGQTFKFSVMYGTAYQLLTAFTNTLSATVQEGIEFQQAVTTLKLAAGDSSDRMEDLAATLGDRSVEAGFAPSQGVLIGARSLGLFGVTGADEATQNNVADISARVVSRLALASGKQPQDLQTNIAAVTSAFGLGAEGQYRVADLDAYFSQKFGVTPGDTIQAVSESGTVGRAAGFSQEEVNAIAADLIARTGQTSSAVAGFMAQIFSRGGEGSLTNIAQRYGIDPSLELAEQMRRLADVYKTASPQEQATLSAAFGRGKVQNAAIALLQDFDRVEEYAARAVTEAPGAADEQYRLRIGDIGGQLALTAGVLKDAAGALGETGLLEVMGGAVVVLRELVQAGTGVLRLWNAMDGTMRAAIAAVVAFTVAARSSAVQQAVLGGASRFMLARQAGAGVVGAASRAGLGALINPATAAIAGLLAIGALKNTSDRLGEAQERAVVALSESDLGPAATVDQLRARSVALGTTADDTREDSSGFFARFINMGADYERNMVLAGSLDAEATRLEALAARREQAQANAEVNGSNVLVKGFDSSSLETALKTITDAGGTAATRLDALIESLGGTADAAERATAAFDLSDFAASNAQGIYDAVLGSTSVNVSRPGLGNIAKNLLTYSGTGDPIKDREYENIAPELLADRLGPTYFQGRLQSVLGQMGLGDISQLSADQAKAAAEQIVQGVPDNAYGEYLDSGQIDQARQQMADAVTSYLLGEADAAKQLLIEGVELSSTELTSVAAQLARDAQELAGYSQTTDYEGRISALRQGIAGIKQAIAQTPDGSNEATENELANLRRMLAEAQIERLESLRRVAQQNASGDAEVASIGRSFFEREVRAAIAGGAQDKLVELVGLAGDYGKRIALQAINDAIKVAREALRVRRAASALLNNPLFNLFGGAGGEVDTSELDELKGIRGALNNAVTGDPDSDPYATGSDVPGLGGTAGAQETAAERAAALAQANATRSESQIQAAKAAIQGARAQLAKAEKGTVAYYSALESLYSAQNALTDAILAYKLNRYLLAGDITDPLDQARAELKAAQDKLRSDRGKGEDVLAEDRVALQQAQANVEATKFQQRLSSVQTAERLGRISHQAYIRYLENEERRLSAIKNRTFQQQQQLDEISGLIQDAQGALQGQFNFGDINLPTPYQVRRYIEQASGGKAAIEAGRAAEAARYTTSSTTTIYIDGADTGKVKRIVEEVTGQRARTTTSTPRRR